MTVACAAAIQSVAIVCLVCLGVEHRLSTFRVIHCRSSRTSVQSTRKERRECRNVAPPDARTKAADTPDNQLRGYERDRQRNARARRVAGHGTRHRRSRGDGRFRECTGAQHWYPVRALDRGDGRCRTRRERLWRAGRARSSRGGSDATAHRDRQADSRWTSTSRYSGPTPARSRGTCGCHDCDARRRVNRRRGRLGRPRSQGRTEVRRGRVGDRSRPPRL